jgi:uncharacterized protein YndB with AHSA1/START domain
MKQGPQRKLTLERNYPGAAIEDLWELWTTAAGIESWWEPAGFAAKVRKLNLRPGGELRYAMTAVGAEQVQFMQQAGLPLTTEATITFSEVVALRRLAFAQRNDFIPGVAPYDSAMQVDFHADARGVRMVIAMEALHDEEWTQRAVMGWEGQLLRLAAAVAARTAARGTG